MMALLIKPNWEYYNISLEPFPKLLPNLQEVIGGYIQFVPLNHSHHGYVDDEGKYKSEQEENPLATKVAVEFGSHNPADIINGPMLVLRDGELGAEASIAAVMNKLLQGFMRSVILNG